MRSVLRIVSALVFFAHGTQKILGFPASDRAFPEVMSRFWIAGVMELIGGALLIIGLFSRPVAFLLSGLMACAYWLAHAPQHWVPALNGGDAAILYCFIFLYIFFAGPGPISVDAMLKRDR
ncbi:DoxX family protein [Paracoccus aurantiacus]|uniref:DoxX family protein n=2 Tax=Paracoccus aurantiacus TaxID=2599412 RepID=A0A5C6SA10_9RHOB|nr:DoxX family protein [Paracoccus aurantiacus]